MKYFAYGSNMCSGRLREEKRVKSAKFVCVARLSRHRLCFHKRSKDGSGKCNAFRTDGPNDEVLGVVFEIDPSEKRRLDKAEGPGYLTIPVDLATDMGAMAVFTYIADSKTIDDKLKPYRWYKECVIAGAEEHGLPKAYIERLYAVDVAPDPE